MLPKDLSQTTFGAGSLDSLADGGGRRHHADASQIGGQIAVGRAKSIPERKCAALDPTALFTHSLDVPLAPEVLLGAKTHAVTPKGREPADRLRRWLPN